jgi:hypothetical protein
MVIINQHVLPSSSFQALNELSHLPDFNILVNLWISLRHFLYSEIQKQMREGKEEKKNHKKKKKWNSSSDIDDLNNVTKKNIEKKPLLKCEVFLFFLLVTSLLFDIPYSWKTCRSVVAKRLQSYCFQYYTVNDWISALCNRFDLDIMNGCYINDPSISC